MALDRKFKTNEEPCYQIFIFKRNSKCFARENQVPFVLTISQESITRLAWGPYHELVHKNEVNTRNKKYANFIMKCMECMVLFNSYLFAQDFSFLVHRGNRGKDTNRGPGESWAEVGSPWARPNLWVGRPKGCPSGLVLFVCGLSRCCVLCQQRAAPPHWSFACDLIQKHMETKTELCWFEDRGVDLFIQLSNMGAHYNLKGNTRK